jgi:energy-coupling factor transporter ATP-binding protein EcfA2
MDKKITSISIDNCRAYYGNYDSISLPAGENLLIYGENGSGKSSLYKAINSYFSSSIDPAIDFVKNRFGVANNGEISITFSDYDGSSGELLPGTQTTYNFTNHISTHQIPFIQAAALSKGFLDYTDLLKVYLHQEDRPNLFNLIVLSLLGDHIPIRSGGNFQFSKKWKQLQKDLTINASKRTDNCHKRAKSELPSFETHLRSTLGDVFRELNRLLLTYFPELGIELRFTLSPLTFNYGPKRNWNTTSDLRLSVIKDGIEITNGYNDFLNEARLSALSICLYLASLLRYPAVDLKVLYLDDVFIGLDAGNRLPILNILNGEFGSFQIFISTYDRHWFELAKKYFDLNSNTSWESIELYVGRDDVGIVEITKPIIIKGSSYFEKGMRYLHNRTNPDYPAAANYFRKGLEELVKQYIPPYELVDSEMTQIPDYSLTSVLYRTKNFIEKTANPPVYINQIFSLLHNLLHPLSHHEISSPIYKSELVILEKACGKLKEQLVAMDISNTFQCCLESNKRLKLTFEVDATVGHSVFFEILSKDAIIIKRNLNGILSIITGAATTVKCHGIRSGATIPAFNPAKNDARFNYNSLDDALDIIYNFLMTTNPSFPKPPNFQSICEYHDGLNWQPLSNLIIWRV